MSLLVKICGLRTEADVLAAVEAGADAVGFVFAKSVRRVTAEEAAAATASLHSDIRKVAVMLHPSNEEWQDVLLEFRPDALQTDIEDIEALDIPDTVQIIPVIREGNPVLDGGLPDVFLYEGASSGQGEVVDWQRAAAVAGRGKMILAGGLSAANLSEAIESVHPFGVDVSSAVESEPGVKSHELIREFIKAARAAEQDL
jgi:phosphoribosylanthranilate isomerase